MALTINREFFVRNLNKERQKIRNFIKICSAMERRCNDYNVIAIFLLKNEPGHFQSIKDDKIVMRKKIIQFY